MKKITSVITGMLVMLFSAAVQAQILKCVGKDGKIEFATACPAGTKQQDTGVSNKPSAAPAPAKDDKGAKAADKGSQPKSLAEQEADFRKRQKEKADAEAKAEKIAIEDARRKVACDEARGQLVQLQNRQRWGRTDPKTGERVLLDEAGYIREIANAERQVAENCK